MNPFAFLLSEVLYRPLYNLIVIFLQVFDANLGLAIIALTVVIRLLLLKPSMAGNQMQQSMWSIQPKMQELQEKYKDDPKKLSEETMKLLKKDGAGPLKGCLSMLIQIPVFIGLFFVVRHVANDAVPAEWLYSFFGSFGAKYLSLDGINVYFLGTDLLATKSVWITIWAAIFTFLQMKLTLLVKPATPTVPGASVPDMSKMMWFMNVFLVVVMGSFVWSTAGAIGLYILTTSLFSVVQYAIQYKVLLIAKFEALFQK
jgi:YidC/Oxa1 family membrane protein insertase